MHGEKDPVVQNCFKKERRNSANLSVASFEGSSTSVASIPLESEECDPGCTGEIRETRHIGGFALPQICDKRICPMDQKNRRDK